LKKLSGGFLDISTEYATIKDQIESDGDGAEVSICMDKGRLYFS
jgi:hypothetical protein